MTKILFFIHDLKHGGAEKVLVNLVNNMDYEKFDITVMTLFNEGVHIKNLNKNIKYGRKKGDTFLKKYFIDFSN